MKTVDYNSTRYLFRRLVKEHISPFRWRFVLAFFLMAVVAATTAANAYIMEPILDDIFLKKDEFMLLVIPLAVLAIAIIKGVANYAQIIIMRTIGQTIVTNMQAQLFGHLLRSDLSILHKEASGKIISRFTNDINILRRSVSNVFTGLIKEVLTLIFLIGVMFMQSVVLAIIAFTVFPLAVYPIIRLGKKMRKVSNSTLDELGNFTEHLDETFRGVRVIKAYQGEEYELKKAKGKLYDILNLYIKAAKTEAATSPIMETLGGISIALVIWYGGFQVMHGETSAGSFFSFIAAFIMAYKPVKTLSSLNTSLQEGMAAAKRLFIMMDKQPEIVDKESAKPLKLSKGTIDFNDVDFSYNPKKPALHDVTLNVPGGKTIALVGASGGGKSTIMNLLLRFYDVNKGDIFIDNQNIKDVTIESLRRNISLVSQDIVLFDDTVAANIAYGLPEQKMDEIVKAAKMAAADDFINDLPDGYNTQIGQSGNTLSGGQRQRIAIARAMLRNAPILLLDEATSALDNISEKKVQSALKSLMKGRTTMVIAHRLSTVCEADIIYVLKRGRVVEHGSHNSLVKNKSSYYNKLLQGMDS